MYPVLEIGGSHVTAALVARPDHGEMSIYERHTFALEPHASAHTLCSAFITAGSALNAQPHSDWGVAIPGPFDYDTGIGRYRDVGKFDALAGLDLGAALRGPLAAASLTFCNDAVAFGVGEATGGAAVGHDKAVALTLGTGIGSCFLQAGHPVVSGSGVPAHGCVHLLQYDGRNIEESMSTRALTAAYFTRTGRRCDVREITSRVRAGDLSARAVWERGCQALTATIAPYLAAFAASVVVVGGSIAKSWDLVEPAIRHGLAAAGVHLSVLPAAHPLDAALLGAASWAAGYR